MYVSILFSLCHAVFGFPAGYQEPVDHQRADFYGAVHVWSGIVKLVRALAAWNTVRERARLLALATGQLWFSSQHPGVHAHPVQYVCSLDVRGADREYLGLEAL